MHDDSITGACLEALPLLSGRLEKMTDEQSG